MTTTSAPDHFTHSLAASLLSPDERTTLLWVCGALFPRLEAAAGDDAELFTADAISLGVPGAMEEALSAVPQEQVQDFRLLLRALDHPLFVLGIIGKAKSFRSLRAEDRERALLAMSTSSVPLARKGFQAVKRLASFLFYSLMDERRSNPTWRGIGYAPMPTTAARDAALTLTTIDAPVQLEADACIIGSGAGGGVVAAELARAGLRVIVLEQGPADQAPQFDQREIVGMQRLYLDRATSSSRDLGVAILAGSCIGGGTTVNWQTSLRLPEPIRHEWASAAGLSMFADERLARAMDAVCDRIGVGTGESAINANNEALRRGCTSLGWRWAHTARNAKGCDATQCGWCVFGCRHGGKQSTAVTYLADAQRTGNVTIVSNCRVTRVLHERGRVNGVRAVARDAHSSMGTEFKVVVRSPIVVAAAGSIETPALLLRSGVRHPALGRNLYLHPTSAVAGVYPDTIRTWEGPPQTVMSDEHATLDGNYGFRLEMAPGHPGLLALALPWHGARAHRAHMQRAGRVAATIALTRDSSSGRVRVRREGRAAIEYRPGPRELSHLKQGIVAAVRAHIAAGAEEVVTLHSRQHTLDVRRATAGTIEDFCRRITTSPLDRNWSTLFSAHQMGTCRMGSDAQNAVCDERGAVRGIGGLYVADASLFPASSGVNPMVTIMALAKLVGESIGAAESR
ncbi:MAG TPA: GMC family oxidoreductase [Gemmatimonadaceae bacterium]|nr:GMC family oxidoreductase [Gemmatimonadaceae bacterium]